MDKRINVAIIGISGYTGLELIKILLNHPRFNITYIANSEGESNIEEIHPSLKNICNEDVHKADAKIIADVAELVFLALPHKSAAIFAKDLLNLGCRVIDLSADYRLELDRYEKHYCLHEDKEHLSEAVYGLPEYNRDKIKHTNLIANPGCYPTASLLAILPFIKYIKSNQRIIIDAKSGVSGAGKKCVHNTHYVTINENIFSYNPLAHRHTPEIEEKISHICNKNIGVIFVPHLLPLTRGMLISAYLKIESDIDPLTTLEEYYKNEKFIRIRNHPVDVKSVAGTNFCDIFAKKDGDILYVNSSIDNLLRGASSQAVVNANIMYGFEEHLAIPFIPYIP